MLCGSHQDAAWCGSPATQNCLRSFTKFVPCHQPTLIPCKTSFMFRREWHWARPAVQSVDTAPCRMARVSLHSHVRACGAGCQLTTPGGGGMLTHEGALTRVDGLCVHGYLAHKKQPPHLGPPKGPRHSPTVGF